MSLLLRVINPDLLCYFLIPYLTIQDYCNLISASGNNRDHTYLDENEKSWKALYATYHGRNPLKLKRKRKGYKIALVKDFANYERVLYRKTMELGLYTIRNKVLTAYGRLHHSKKMLGLADLSDDLGGNDHLGAYGPIRDRKLLEASVQKRQRELEKSRRLLKVKKDASGFEREFREKFGVHGCELVEEPKRKKIKVAPLYGCNCALCTD